MGVSTKLIITASHRQAELAAEQEGIPNPREWRQVTRPSQMQGLADATDVIVVEPHLGYSHEIEDCLRALRHLELASGTQAKTVYT
jgi:hypothetical protein